MKKTERFISIILLFIISLSNVSTPVSYAAEQVASSSSQSNPSIDSGATTTPVAPPKFRKPDSGSVLGASTSLFEIGTQEGMQTSASKRMPIRMQRLGKKVFAANEDVQLAVTDPDNEAFTTAVVDEKGQAVAAPITETNDGTTTNVQISASNEIKPGKYTVKITDQEGDVTTQDFSWGVLALNTDKTIYHPGEKADISLAVLDDQGNMVCNASLELRITNQELGIDETLSTENKKIQENEQCQHHDFSLQPDYEAQYTFGGVGNYQFQLTATTDNGTHSITDNVQVKNQIPFDVQRVSATRIYPPNTYPMTVNITANKDFSGIVTETVPEDFVITPATASAHSASSGSATTPVNSYNDMQTVYLNSNSPEAQLQQAISASSSGGLIMPFHGNYPITQGFGAQMTDPTLQAFYTQYGLAGHDGIDFGVPMDTPLYAVDDGNILQAGPGDYGTTIIIQHGWGESYYGHLSTTAVTVGTHVTKGQLIGYSGESGEATGPHLHFGMKPLSPDMTNGYYGKVDPLSYLPYNNQSPQAAFQSAPITDSNPSTGSGSSTPSSTVLSASTSATTDSDASDSAEVSPSQISPSAGSGPTATDTPTISQTPVSLAPTSQPTPTEAAVAPLFQITGPSTGSGSSTNSTFSVIDKEILASEQLANNSQTEKVKVITWNVSLKKGESTSLGYDYQIPHTSPQFYLLGPIQMYQKGSNKVVFQEQRQWQLASDDVGVEWYSNTTGNPWNGYSWQYRKKIDINSAQVSAAPTVPTVDFMDSGGDSTNGSSGDIKLTTSTGGFYTSTTGTVAYDTTAKETGPGSIKFTTSGTGVVANVTTPAVLADAGSRVSAYYDFTTAFSNLTGTDTIMAFQTTAGTQMFALRVTTGGVLQLVAGTGSGTQIGSGTPTLSTGTWTRISVGYTVTNATTYTITVYVNGTSSITASNSTTLGTTGTNKLVFGWITPTVGNNQVMNIDDVYVDSGTDHSDTGDVHVTAKRPFANGTTNQFTTGIGSNPGSPYGSGNAERENERPLNTANAWSLSLTTRKTEEYNIEGASVGDVDLTGKTILSTEGWIDAQESTTANAPVARVIFVPGSPTTVTLTTSAAMYTVIGSSTYPAGTGADIGMDGRYTTTAGTFTLNEAGVQVAYLSTSPALTNFPVLVSLSGDADLIAHAQSTAADVLFTDSTGETLLPFELENASGGTSVSSSNLLAWVDVPSLSSSADTIIYMYYGNPSATSLASNATTWDTNYKGVWHFGEDTGVTTHDSTSNTNNGTLSGTGGPGWTAGQIGNAINFTAATQIDDAGSASSLDNMSPLSIETWVDPTTTTGAANRAIVQKTDSEANLGNGWAFAYNATDPGWDFQASFAVTNDLERETTSATANVWQDLVLTWDGTGNASNVHIYVNGVEQTYVATQNGGGAYNSDGTSDLEIGQFNDKTSGDNFIGNIDEVRVSNTIRSPGWILTEYNNQSAPGSFYTLGGVETDIYAPTLGQLMRHGQWFSAEGQVQPFTF